MAIEIIGDRIEVDGLYISLSEGVVTGDVVTLSGMIAFAEDGSLKLDGDISEQTEKTIQHIERILAKVGCELGNVYKSLVVLKRQEDFGGFNEAYGKYFPSNPPARTTLIADLVHPDVLVEIEMQAYKPRG